MKTRLRELPFILQKGLCKLPERSQEYFFRGQTSKMDAYPWAVVALNTCDQPLWLSAPLEKGVSLM
jgi:hypothetical protein